MKRLNTLIDSKWALLIPGAVLGALLILGIRFITYSPDVTHYHANFGVFINGEKENFKGQQYYEDVNICSLSGTTPEARTHMHSEENGVIHIHDDAVTWGHLFTNLGWTLGPDFIATDKGTFTASDTAKLNIVLNDQDLTDQTDLTNVIIKDTDRLLLSYGDISPDELDKQYALVRKDADAYNQKQDPSSCGGSETPTVTDRFNNLF